MSAIFERRDKGSDDMAHPLVEEFCRAGQLRPDFFRRCQRVFRAEVIPQLDERETLLAENATLKAEVAGLKAKKAKAEPAVVS